MSLAFIHRLPVIGRGSVLARRFHRGVSANDKICVNILSKEKAVSMSWPSVEKALSYQIAYRPALSEEYNLLVSSGNSTVLNNLSTGVVYSYTISPLTLEKGLLDPIHSGEVSLEVIILCLQLCCYQRTNLFCFPMSMCMNCRIPRQQ